MATLSFKDNYFLGGCKRMEVIIVETPLDGAKEAFDIFSRVKEQGGKVYGLATGSTPIELYKLLVASELDFSDCVSVNLDEYVGLAGDDEHSYRYFMNEQLFYAKPFKESFVPDGLAPEDTEIARYEQVLADNPIDLQLLGLGSNAHIGFNEPGTDFSERTHKVHLTESTINANKRFFANEEDVPRYAYSMGPASIMDAKEVVLMAFGEGKAQAVKDMIEGEVTPKVPASILQNHEHVTIIIDQAAAQLLADTE